MTNCKFEACQLPVFCKGFCRKHSTAFYRGLITEDGRPTSDYKPRPKDLKCRYPNCQRPHHGNRWCNKHRKWFAKGQIDENCNVLDQKVLEVKPTKCKVCGSKKMKGQGFCIRHYASFHAGVIDVDGERLKPKVRYPKDFQCIVPTCGTIGGKFVRGMCKKHYNMALSGIIDWQGVTIRKLKRVASYGSRKCKVCSKRARSVGFCHNHFEHLRNGNIDKKGKWLVPPPVRNKGRKCSIPECQKEAHCKTLCVLHYNRKRSGYLGPEGYKNVGKVCTEDGCSSPAAVRSVCTKHYYHLKKKEKQELSKPSESNPDCYGKSELAPSQFLSKTDCTNPAQPDSGGSQPWYTAD